MTDRLLDAVGRDLAALESALAEVVRAQDELPGPELVAAPAAIRERMVDLPSDDPAVEMARIRTLAADARIAWFSRQDVATVPAFDEVVARCRTLVDEGGDAAAEAAGCSVEMSTDTAMVFLALGDLTEAERRLRQADAVCEVCDVEAVLRLDLLNVWCFVDLGCTRFGQALQHAEKAVELGREVGGESMITAISNLAQTCRHLGDGERARSLYGQILASPSRTKAQDRSARLGRAVVTALVDPRRAVPMLQDVVGLAQQDQDGERLAHAAATLGSIAQADGQTDLARHWYATAAEAARAPSIVAGCLALLANLWSDHPAVAEQFRRKARRVAREVSVESAVMVDFVTSRDLLAGSFAEDELDIALPAALAIDVWRIDLPSSLREPWQQIDQQSGGTGRILQLAQGLGRHSLVAALVAHLCAIIPPGLTGDDDPRPPRVLVAGEDPLAGAARAAVARYGRSFRDDTRTFSACSSTDGCLDLVAVGRGDGYLCWRRPSTGQLHSVRVRQEDLDPHLTALALASDAALAPPGESALLHGPSELDLMRRLGACLLPPELVSDLPRASVGGPFGQLRVRADGDLAGVPWGLLVAPAPDARSGEDTRLVELVDVVALAPFGLPVPEATASAADVSTGGMVAVLDPRVPGFAADSALGSVLGRMPPGSSLEQRMHGYLDAGRLVARPESAEAPPRSGGLLRRRDQDRTWLAEALSARPARLIYLGHVSTVLLTDGVTSEPALHLCCSAAVQGNAAPLGAHRPLAASDVLAHDWPFPLRVALVACASGDDARTRDAYGLVHSMLCRGAGLVTGLLWPLPTGQWYASPRSIEGVEHQGTGGHTDDPLVALTLAVDQAHESDDPVRWLCRWQRQRLHRWRATQSLVDSPIGWGGLHTVVPADPVDLPR